MGGAAVALLFAGLSATRFSARFVTGELTSALLLAGVSIGLAGGVGAGNARGAAVAGATGATGATGAAGAGASGGSATGRVAKKYAMPPNASTSNEPAISVRRPERFAGDAVASISITVAPLVSFSDFLERGAPVLCVEVDAKGRQFWELNNPADVPRIEAMLALMGVN